MRVVNAILSEEHSGHAPDDAMELDKPLVGAGREGPSNSSGAVDDAVAAFVVRRVGQAVTLQAPLFSISTPYELMVRQLLRYDRETQLMPSVVIYANQVMP